jgi:hypothetical protein
LLGVKLKKCFILSFSVDVEYADLYIRDIELYGIQHKEMLELYKTHDLEKVTVNGKEINKLTVSLKALIKDSDYTHLVTYLETELGLTLNNKRSTLI